MRIIVRVGSETLYYAATELLKYTGAMTNCTLSPTLEQVDCLPDPLPEDAIVLGLLSDLGLDTSDLQDPFIEDIVDVRVQNYSGYIAGSNERSVLMGVYDYCKSAGCRFIRPGDDGEYIPQCDLAGHSFVYRKKADYPFRGTCCEGAISYEHMRDTVYWMPKMGMNMFMIEGIVPFNYMHRWYGHEGNRILRVPGQISDYAELEGYIARLEKDVKRVGLQLHTAGHAWMFEGFGIHHLDPATEMAQVAAMTPEQKELLAQVGGVRELFQRSTFFTHFCYSNPKARRFLVDFCVDYIKKHPYVDYLHLWLADSANNQCECENCVKMQPSDWYVMLLNEIDEALEGIESQTRLVFILYNETVRPPEKLRLKRPERYLMLAAIGQHYETGYLNEEYTDEIPPYVHNHNGTPKNALRLHWHREWKRLCNNAPSLIYEYRYYTDHYCDPGYMRVTRETYRDMRSLENVSFQGCMSDQTHRNFMPTALPMLVMGETLFDTSLDLEGYTNDYFAAAFGKDGALCREYLETLSKLFCPANVRGGAKNLVEDVGINSVENKAPFRNNPWVASQLEQLPAVLDEFLPVIRRNLMLENATQRLSWQYLEQHAYICRYYAKLLLLGAQDKMDEAREVLEELEIYLSGKEMQIHRVFDNFLFIQNARGLLGVKRVKAYL